MSRPIDTVPARIDENGNVYVRGAIDENGNLLPDGGALSGDGRKVVTTAGVREVLGASTPATWVQITALDDNGGAVVIGGATTVVADLETRRGTPLLAGEDLTVPVSNLADVGLDVEVSGDGVSYTYGA